MALLTCDQFNELCEKQEKGEATQKELDALEPYKARRAVLLASGFGSRMKPVTLNTPKPLVNVRGRQIISTILDALLAIDITEIYIVTGYLKEQFELLKDRYPTITLLDNPIYDQTNNISSAYVAKDYFKNAYVFESDLFLVNPSLLKKYRFNSCYMGVPVASTPDWCFDVEDGRIVDLHKGGSDCYHMFGISYWNANDGEKLSVDLSAAFSKDENRQRFWDDVPCVLSRDNYRILIEPCAFDDVVEIDSFAELQEIDPRYKVDM
ncbi:NTP transferase domain-containing protein [Collinsella bouchesdurhonensis]|uniref:NTP transferase domain-containing protein n=1 Tax=Collinsella bouchesdurhonensis TaxID=1907654 RepID=UPI00096A27C2|nr:NTP transferase domain-containing protein [Collinsella bouchesdurhonensis]